ncbi:MAG: D-tyrosyl-tRNA(Tyr) deacylase [Spirochaetes bacterium]|nr:MAG: D-tyrosyl-tRNA(Tyr) deacylase [Spirochaetota bacterium]
MRAVVQRCSDASVSVEKEGTSFVSGSIDQGLLVYLGVGREDREEDATYLADKIANLRIFMDSEEKMNLSVRDLGLGVLAVSQFTLFADARKGRRPSFSEAGDNETARALYEKFCCCLSGYGLKVETGVFKEMMKVRYTNEGPITILLDSKKAF